MDPVRFQQGGGRDGMVMAGTDVRGYDVPHQLVEQLYRDTGGNHRCAASARQRFATEAFADEGRAARHRSAGVPPRTFKGTPRA